MYTELDPLQNAIARLDAGELSPIGDPAPARRSEALDFLQNYPIAHRASKTRSAEREHSPFPTHTQARANRAR